MIPIIRLTVFERNIIMAMLSQNLLDAEVSAVIVDKLVVKDRFFSEDTLDTSKCCGFYLHFAENDVLKGIESVPHHIGLQGNHKELPVGADFVLFIKPNGIDFLEASFYGDTLPIELLLSDHPSFNILGLRRS